MDFPDLEGFVDLFVLQLSFSSSFFLGLDFGSDDGGDFGLQRWWH